MKTTLIIARHGNTFSPGDIVLRVGGRTDLPLSPSGHEQARKLGHYLRENKLLPDSVYSSPLRRTTQTAEDALATAGAILPITNNPLFTEIDYGVDEGRPETSVVARIGNAALKAWEDEAIVPDGWEVDPKMIIQGWNDFGRALTTSHAGKRVLVVTSNGIARFAPYLTGDFEAFRQKYKLKLPTGGLGSLSRENGAWTVEAWGIKP